MRAAARMKPPKVAVFDLGKVLVDFDYSIAARRVASHSSISVDPVRFFSEHAPLLLRYELGQITTRQFFEEVRHISGFSGAPEQFGEFFADIFTEIPEMTGLHAQVRSKGCPTYIFSNTNELAVSHIRRRFPFFANFDGYLYSYEHGAIKPDAKLYEVVERATKCRGGEILYIDDRPENIETGAARGWQAVLHESPETTRAALARARLV